MVFKPQRHSRPILHNKKVTYNSWNHTAVDNIRIQERKKCHEIVDKHAKIHTWDGFWPINTFPAAKHFWTEIQAISESRQQNFSHTMKLTTDLCASMCSVWVWSTGCFKNPPWEENFEILESSDDFLTRGWVHEFPSFSSLHNTKKKWCKVWNSDRTQSNWTWKRGKQNYARQV